MSQNGNAYEDGFVASFWDPIWAYAAVPTPATEAPLHAAFELDTIGWPYVTGVADPTSVSPDTWTHHHALVNRPGDVEIQLALFRDYATNRPLYPKLHEWFRSRKVPLLAVWGGHDEIFGPDGARALTRDLPAARVALLDTGHFALETHLQQVSDQMLTFLDTDTSRYDRHLTLRQRCLGRGQGRPRATAQIERRDDDGRCRPADAWRVRAWDTRRLRHEPVQAPP